MPKKSQRAHGTGVLAVVGVASVLFAALLGQASSAIGAGQEAGSPAGAEKPVASDQSSYGRVLALRMGLRLGDREFAAMGCTQSQGEAALNQLAAWDKAQGTTWVARREDVAVARAALRKAEREVQTGPRNPALLARLPDLQQAAEQARQAESDLLATAIQQVEGGLTDAQRQVWATARANPPGDYAYAPSLTAAQRKALAEAHVALARGHATAKALTDHAAAEDGLARAVDGILTPTQKTAIATAQANIKDYLPAATAATKAVLPPPEGWAGRMPGADKMATK